VRSADGAILKVDPLEVQIVAGGLRDASTLVGAQRRVCAGIEVAGRDPSIGPGLASFVSTWGLAVTALAYELDLLGVELGRSARAVTAVDRAGTR
jgi:hypothetical protein